MCVSEGSGNGSGTRVRRVGSTPEGVRCGWRRSGVGFSDSTGVFTSGLNSSSTADTGLTGCAVPGPCRPRWCPAGGPSPRSARPWAAGRRGPWVRGGRLRAVAAGLSSRARPKGSSATRAVLKKGEDAGGRRDSSSTREG